MIDAFFAETSKLYKQLSMKGAEKRTLMQIVNPDPDAISKITGELYELRLTIQEQAQTFGVNG